MDSTVVCRWRKFRFASSLGHVPVSHISAVLKFRAHTLTLSRTEGSSRWRGLPWSEALTGLNRYSHNKKYLSYLRCALFVEVSLRACF